ncbi:hypothetical protein [Rhodanobacter sp. BL-MT-08]
MTATAKLYAVLAILIVLVLTVVGTGFWVHHYGAERYAQGVTDGQNKVLADDANAAQQIQAKHTADDAFSLTTTGDMLAKFNRDFPALDTTANETKTQIVTIYRNRPATDVACSRPAGVQASLDQAVARANAAAAGHL